MTKIQHSIKLPTFREPFSKTPEYAREVIAGWVDKFNQLLTNGDLAELPSLFRSDAWIRDFLSLSWDFRTIQGLHRISGYFQENLRQTGLRNIEPRETGAFAPAFRTVAPGVHWVDSMFDFENDVGRGKGVVRLVEEEDNVWKAYMINFTLQELKNVEEKAGINRPTGKVDPKGGNWKERRDREREFLDEDPAVLVVGAGEWTLKPTVSELGSSLMSTCIGHAGINIGVRLRHLGVSALMIDRNERVGDSWRKRYRVSQIISEINSAGI